MWLERWTRPMEWRKVQKSNSFFRISIILAVGLLGGSWDWNLFRGITHKEHLGLNKTPKFHPRGDWNLNQRPKGRIFSKTTQWPQHSNLWQQLDKSAALIEIFNGWSQCLEEFLAKDKTFLSKNFWEIVLRSWIIIEYPASIRSSYVCVPWL